MKKKFGVAAALAVVFTITTAAQDQDDYAFTLVNRSSVAVTQFNGFAGGRWSRNWLDYQVPAGEEKALRFSDNATEDCAVRVRVTFLDESYFEDTVNFCGISHLYVGDRRMWSE